MVKQFVCILTLGILAAASSDFAMSQNPTHHSVKTGYSMKMRINNVGAIGHVAYPPFNALNPGAGIPADSLGLEYPIGARVEHLFGGGIWIGGMLDTSAGGTSAPLRLVSTSYEGWAGNPYYEFYPGNGPNDRFWTAKKDDPKPAGWDDYWQGGLQFQPISDEDFYCTYTDTAVRSGLHVPLGLKVIQSSYTWSAPYAEAIVIFEYRIINMGRHQIDSAFIGYFFEADVGPIDVPNYHQRNFSAFIDTAFIAYIHNPQDAGSTPVGAVLLDTTIPRDSLQRTFQWFPGPQTPATDAAKYNLMASNTRKPDEVAVSDTRFLFSFGPFTMPPGSVAGPPDTLKIAVAVISGYSRQLDHRVVLSNNASRALNIYKNQGIQLPAIPPSPPLRVNVGFRRVELDWKWRPGDSVLFGRNDPELNWDSTNIVVRAYPERITNPPPGFDSTRGGRNFEAYRVWRSENPSGTDASFTLLKQYDVPTDSFEFNTGLQYTLVDSNLVRGKTYVYSVTSLSVPNIAFQGADEVHIDALESGKSVNAVRVDLPFAVSREINKVSVVPNPYRTDKDYKLESGGYEGLSSGWDENRRLVKFINLPEICTVRVFSLSGDLIRTIHHDGREATGFSRGDHNMPLVSESNRALASGIYVFTVESELGTQTGKFVIIR